MFTSASIKMFFQNVEGCIGMGVPKATETRCRDGYCNVQEIKTGHIYAKNNLSHTSLFVLSSRKQHCA